MSCYAAVRPHEGKKKRVQLVNHIYLLLQEMIKDFQVLCLKVNGNWCLSIFIIYLDPKGKKKESNTDDKTMFSNLHLSSNPHSNNLN